LAEWKTSLTESRTARSARCETSAIARAYLTFGTLSESTLMRGCRLGARSRDEGKNMRLTPDQIIYLMEIAAKNADAYSMTPLQLFSAMHNRIEEIVSDGEANDKGTEGNP
jgi:hypothetical protein